MEVNLAGAWMEYIFYFPERKYKFLKDRQHQSRGDIGISFIARKVNDSEDRAIYQTKARIFLHPLICSIKIRLINCRNNEVKTDFFTFIFCANTAHLIFHPWD